MEHPSLRGKQRHICWLWPHGGGIPGPAGAYISPSPESIDSHHRSDRDSPEPAAIQENRCKNGAGRLLPAP